MMLRPTWLRTVQWVALGLCIVSVRAALANSFDDWLGHRDRLLRDASVERFYAFEWPIYAGTAIPSLVGTRGNLEFQVTGKTGVRLDTLRLVDGRWPQKSAVRLDQGCLRGQSVGVGSRGFTVEMWTRIQGPGTHQGNNNAPNGTLISFGNGYWEGFRITASYIDQTIGFEIGRPQPSSSVGVSAKVLEDDFWHHLAASWDGKEMRLYVDGLRVARKDYRGAYTPPQNGAFRLGYAAAGVGSVIMDVDEAVIFNRALTVQEILSHACLAPPLSERQAARFERAAELSDQKNWSGARAELEPLLQEAGHTSSYTATVRLKLAKLLIEQKQYEAAGGEFAQIAQDRSLPESRVRSAQRQLLKLFREFPGQPFPATVWRLLLSHEDITPQEKLAVRLAEAHSLFSTGSYANARRSYAFLATNASASLPMRSIAQLRIAESFAREKNYSQAKAALAVLISWKGEPAHLRQEAQERLGELERLQAGLPARDPLASRRPAPQFPKPGIELYVAPQGQDRNPGTQEQPFATLEKARDTLRALRRSQGLPHGGAAVLVRGGDYQVTQTFVLRREDSGTQESPIVYRAYPGERPRFSGGTGLRGFKPLSDPSILERLAESARGKVYQLDLKSLGITNWGKLNLAAYASGRGFITHPNLELFFDGKAMSLARWPNEGYREVGDLLGTNKFAVWGRIPGVKDGKFSYEGDRPSRWNQEPDAWLYGYWFWDWADSYESIAGIDTKNRVITLKPPYSRYGYRQGQRYYALNLLSEIDQPEEYYLDRQSGVLYFYPPSNPDAARIEVSLFAPPFLELNGVVDVAFCNLTWETGQGDGVIINGGQRCLLAGCTIRQFAGNGVEIRSGIGHGLLSCDIYNLGRGGAALRGGDRVTLRSGEHFVENCHIHHVSRIDHTYTPAIRLEGVGTRVAHNHLHHSYSSAMRVEGNDHLIEFNNIHDVLLESDDQGGADMWGNPTYRGNVYRYNYWHDLGNGMGTGQAGIRLDDAICGTLIYGNVFYRCAVGLFGGVQIHGGKDNIIDNNLFVDCHAAISFSPWTENQWQQFLKDRRALLQEVNADQAPYLTRYPDLARLHEGINENRVWRNLVYQCDQFLMRSPGKQELVDNLITTEDPGFENAAQGQFQFKDGARILNRFAFRPIPFEEIGLYPDEYRP